MSGIMAPSPRSVHDRYVLRPFLVALARRIFRRSLRDWSAIETYLRKPHGRFHTCPHCDPGEVGSDF